MWGWSEFSNAVIIRAASVPAQMATPTTTIDSTTGGVKISWTAPANNGNTLTAYLIEILDLAETTWSTTTHCDGSTSTIFSQRYCIIAMSALITTPFSLTLDTLVKVRISASNAVGFGPVSSTNTDGARVRTIPTTMNDPERGDATTTTSIEVTWDALVSPLNGNTNILSY